MSLFFCDVLSGLGSREKTKRQTEIRFRVLEPIKKSHFWKKKSKPNWKLLKKIMFSILASWGAPTKQKINCMLILVLMTSLKQKSILSSLKFVLQSIWRGQRRNLLRWKRKKKTWNELNYVCTTITATARRMIYMNKTQAFSFWFGYNCQLEKD